MARTRKKTRGPRGGGTCFFHEGRGLWVGRRIIGRKANKEPLYAERSGRTQSEVLAKLAAAGPPGPSVTVGEWAARWLAEQKVRPNTLDSRRETVTYHVTPALGGVPVAALTPYQVEGACRTWGQRLAPGTVRRVLSILRTCLAAACRAGIRPDNPAALARAPRGGAKKIDPFTPAELSRIVAASCPDPHARWVALLASTGMRAGEAFGLDVGDFDPGAGTVAITRTYSNRRVGPPKSANGVRTIRVPAAALPALVAARGGREAGILFPAPFSRKRVLSSAGAKVWGRVLRKLGIRYRSVHSLRHSVATLLIAAGVGLADVAHFLGDSVQTIVKTYVHPSGTDPADAIERLLAPE